MPTCPLASSVAVSSTSTLGAFKGGAYTEPPTDVMPTHFKVLPSVLLLPLGVATLPSPRTLFFLFWGQVPPLLASVPRNPDGPRQIHRFPFCGFGFQPERTETARDLAKHLAVIEDTYTEPTA